MKKALFATLALAFLSTSTFARGYQAQGCGLGSTLFTDGSSLVHQVLGATTNGCSGNQTFGMTSGTSNCELEAVKGKRAQVVFIEANKVALSNDIARGNGPTLTSLVDLYGCKNVQNAGVVLQKNYGAVFTGSANAAQIDSSISSILASEKACI